MLSLIVIDVQHSQKAVFSFEKGLNCQNHSLGSLHPVKNPPPSVKSVIPPPHPPPTPSAPTLRPAIWKIDVTMLGPLIQVSTIQQHSLKNKKCKIE